MLFLINQNLMIRAIIVEDEDYMRKEIKSLIQENFPVEITIVSEANNVLDAVSKIEQFQPNLVFFDVQLPDGTGFDIILKSKFKDFNIIFITGFDSAAIKAIKVGALDYILKPIDEIEFIEAVKKAILNKDNSNNQLNTSIEVTKDYYQGNNDRIIFKTSDNIHLVNTKEILYCQSEANYTTVYLENEETILLSKHIKKIEELLNSNIFIRCHQSYLVNKYHVKKFNKNGHLLISNNSQIPVSGRRRKLTLDSIF